MLAVPTGPSLRALVVSLLFLECILLEFFMGIADGSIKNSYGYILIHIRVYFLASITIL